MSTNQLDMPFQCWNVDEVSSSLLLVPGAVKNLYICIIYLLFVSYDFFSLFPLILCSLCAECLHVFKFL